MALKTSSCLFLSFIGIARLSFFISLPLFNLFPIPCCLYRNFFLPFLSFKVSLSQFLLFSSFFFSVLHVVLFCPLPKIPSGNRGTSPFRTNTQGRSAPYGLLGVIIYMERGRGRGLLVYLMTFVQIVSAHLTAHA